MGPEKLSLFILLDFCFSMNILTLWHLRTILLYQSQISRTFCSYSMWNRAVIHVGVDFFCFDLPIMQAKQSKSKKAVKWKRAGMWSEFFMQLKPNCCGNSIIPLIVIFYLFRTRWSTPFLYCAKKSKACVFIKFKKRFFLLAVRRRASITEN